MPGVSNLFFDSWSSVQFTKEEQNTSVWSFWYILFDIARSDSTHFDYSDLDPRKEFKKIAYPKHYSGTAASGRVFFFFHVCIQIH